MNIVHAIVLCCLSFLIGWGIGNWKEGAAVSKAIDDLSTMHYKEIQLIVDKILKSRKDEMKGGE